MGQHLIQWAQTRIIGGAAAAAEPER